MEFKIRMKKHNENYSIFTQEFLFSIGVKWITGCITPSHFGHLFIRNGGISHCEFNDKFFDEDRRAKEAKLTKDTKIARKMYGNIIAEKNGYILVEVKK